MKRNAFVESIANKIIDLGLATPTILLLEAHKPLSFVGSQFLLIAQPTLDLFLPQNFMQNSINLLADPYQLEQLIIRLENDQQRTLADEPINVDNWPDFPAKESHS